MAKAIAARIETLDEAFLVTLQGFVQAADAEGDAAVAGALCAADWRCRLLPADEPCMLCCWLRATGAAQAICMLLCGAGVQCRVAVQSASAASTSAACADPPKAYHPAGGSCDCGC